jgi:hypothetical protein
MDANTKLKGTDVMSGDEPARDARYEAFMAEERAKTAAEQECRKANGKAAFAIADATAKISLLDFKKREAPTIVPFSKRRDADQKTAPLPRAVEAAVFNET